MRLLLKTIFDTGSGYGNDGCGMAMALSRIGVDVRLAPIGVVPPIPQEVARLLTFPLEPPFDAMLVHVDPLAMKVEDSTPRVVKRVVGWTMWEWLDFRPAGYTSYRKNMRNFDAVLAYDNVTYEALRPHTPKRVGMQTLQGGYWSEDWPYVRREWTGTFRYCMVGALHDRKNPFAAIEAFNILKQEHGDDFDAELVLKTNKPGLHPKMEDAYSGIKIHYAMWPVERIRALYANSHCLLAPSRGEGKNVPALEAQSTGMPVIATNFGGHTQWLGEDWAYPLDFTLKEYPHGRAAEVDPEVLAKSMWHVYENRDEAREKGFRASQVIPAMCDWEKIALRLKVLLDELPSHEMGDSLGI